MLCALNRRKRHPYSSGQTVKLYIELFLREIHLLSLILDLSCPQILSLRIVAFHVLRYLFASAGCFFMSLVLESRKWKKKLDECIKSGSDWFIILLLRATQMQNEREATHSYFVHRFNLDLRISPLLALQKKSLAHAFLTYYCINFFHGLHCKSLSGAKL